MKHRASHLPRYCKKKTFNFRRKKIKNAEAEFFDSDVATVIYSALKIKVLCENATPE